MTPDAAPLTVVVAGGVLFLAFVLLFTNAREWLSDQTTVNRATLHLAPLVVRLDARRVPRVGADTARRRGCRRRSPSR